MPSAIVGGTLIDGLGGDPIKSGIVVVENGKNMSELKYMVDWLGMTPMEVIVGSTSNAAQCLERPELGALVPAGWLTSWSSTATHSRTSA